MQMLFSFDTEDFVDPVSNDALKSLAELHSRHAVPACFGLVGEKARFLRACGRCDVIEAVGRHEVGYHSDHHYMFADEQSEIPYTPEHMERESWERAVARLVAEEARGVHDVEEIFGVRPSTWLRTYGDWAPQYLAAFDRVGIRVFAYGPPFHLDDPAPIWYCNQLVVANPRIMYENNLHNNGMSAAEKLEAHKKAVLAHLEKGTERLGVVTHPTRFISDIWWEEPNWWGGIVTPPPRGTWLAPPRFSREKTAELLWIVDEFLRFVAEMPDLEPVSFSAFDARFAVQPTWFSRAQVVRLAAAAAGRLRWGQVDGVTLSPAELFGVFTFALAHPEAEMIPLRSLYGPTEEPVTAAASRLLPRGDLAAAAQLVEYGIQDNPRVPHVVRTGVGPVGPGSYVLAAAAALADAAAGAITVPEDPGLPEPLHPGDYEALEQRGPCTYIQKRGAFAFPRTTRLGQLQYWTVKPAAGG